MADKRRPDTVLWIRHGKGTSTKVEVFGAGQFDRLSRFTDKQGRPVPEDGKGYHRLRVDGAWFPAGRRLLFTKTQISVLIRNEVFRQ